MNNSTNKSSSITLSLLLVAFIVLKLCGVIDWSWWWVLSPVWISLVIGIIVFVAVLIIGFIKEKKGKKKDE